jgi:hypothetical protein
MENALAQKKFIYNFSLKTYKKNHLRHGRRSEDNIKTDVKVWRDCGLDWTGSGLGPANYVHNARREISDRWETAGLSGR